MKKEQAHPLLYSNVYLSSQLKSRFEKRDFGTLYDIEEVEAALAFQGATLKAMLDAKDPTLPFASIEALEKGLDWEDEEKDNMCLEDIIQTLIPFFLWLSVIFRLLK